ncbi:MAG: insulinase family protein [Polyangiales bacterium]
MKRAALLALTLVACAAPSTTLRRTLVTPAHAATAPTVVAEAPPPLDDTPSVDAPVERATLANGLRVAVSPMPESDRAVVAWVVRGAGYGADELPAGAARRLAEAVVRRASRASAALPGEHAPFVYAYRVHPGAALFWATLHPGEVGAAVASFAAAVQGFGESDVAPDAPAPPALPPRAPWERLRYEGAWDPRLAALGDGAPPPARSLAALFQRAYAPAAVSLVVAGAADGAAVRALAEGLLGPWRGGGGVARTHRPFRLAIPAAQVWSQEPPRTPFAELRARLALPAPDARALAAARVACTLLEYRSGSRLFTRLREAGGAAYAFDTLCEEGDGVYSIDVVLTVTPERAPAAARELRAALASLAAEGVGGGEFARARSLLARRERGRLDAAYDRAFALLEAEGDDDLRGELERPWLRALRAMTAAEASAWLAAEARAERATLFVRASAAMRLDAAAMAAAFPGAVARDDALDDDVARRAHREPRPEREAPGAGLGDRQPRDAR